MGVPSLPGTVTSRTTTLIVMHLPPEYGTNPGLYNMTISEHRWSFSDKIQIRSLSKQTGAYPTITGFNPDSGVNTASLPFTIQWNKLQERMQLFRSRTVSTNKTVAGTLTGRTVIKCSLPLTGLPIGLYNLTVRNTDDG